MKTISLTLSLLLLPLMTHAEGFPENISLKNGQLQKCSQTEITVMKFIDVAKAALFSSDCSRLPRLTDDLQLSFIYQRDFAGEDFIEAAETLLQRNLSETDYQQIETELDNFNQHYQAVEEGDRYDIRLTRAGLYLIKNDEVISHSSSLVLGKRYYQIWFGQKPFNDKMKQALLSPAG